MIVVITEDAKADLLEIKTFIRPPSPKIDMVRFIPYIISISSEEHNDAAHS
jgi:hypothetical protein